jgi:hypothetical protein
VEIPNQVIEFDHEINRIKAMRDVLLQEQAEKECPYKIGDVVPNKKDFFFGEGELCKITRITFTPRLDGTYLWNVAGVFLSEDMLSMYDKDDDIHVAWTSQDEESFEG